MRPTFVSRGWGIVWIGILYGILVSPAAAQPLGPSVPSSPVPPFLPTAPIVSGLGALASPDRISTGIQLLALLTVLALAPSILMMLTSFVRIVVVLGFIRRAMGTQEVPPNQVILGLALFLTFFVMAPTLGQVNDRALQPYIAGELGPVEAFDTAMQPIREFLFSHCRKADLALFIRLGKIQNPRGKEDIPTHVLIPSFLISELKTAFIIGFVIYIPFLVIDMVISSILLSMGMMMLPPVIISLPFKVLLFVLVDGWNLVIGSLMRSF